MWICLWFTFFVGLNNLTEFQHPLIGRSHVMISLPPLICPVRKLVLLALLRIREPPPTAQGGTTQIFLLLLYWVPISWFPNSTWGSLATQTLDCKSMAQGSRLAPGIRKPPPLLPLETIGGPSWLSWVFLLHPPPSSSILCLPREAITNFSNFLQANGRLQVTRELVITSWRIR